MFKPIIAILFACVLLATLSACERQETFIGTISDSTCAAQHPEDEHSTPVSAKQCTLICIRDGAQFVFLAPDSRSYTFDDQRDARLREYAGEAVAVRGAITNGTIHVSDIGRAPAGTMGH
jgi:hypothetical protein